MFPFSFILSPCALALSICTSTGVFVHDMHLDKAAVTALSMPVVTAAYEKASIPQIGASHTHTERGSLSQTLHDLRSTTPRMLPREDQRKHVLAKRVVRGVHAFDGYYTPLGEI